MHPLLNTFFPFKQYSIIELGNNFALMLPLGYGTCSGFKGILNHQLSAVRCPCFVQSDDEEAQDSPATFVRSRLLSGLSDDNIRDVAMLAATFGPIVQIDGPDPNKRVVLPLHPEILQAILLQTLKQAEESQVCSAATLL